MAWQVVILVGGGAFAWWVFYAPEGVRSAIEEMAAPITGFCGSAFGWVQDKISGICFVLRSGSQRLSVTTIRYALHVCPVTAEPLLASFPCQQGHL